MILLDECGRDEDEQIGLVTGFGLATETQPDAGDVTQNWHLGEALGGVIRDEPAHDESVAAGNHHLRLDAADGIDIRLVELAIDGLPVLGVDVGDFRDDLQGDVAIGGNARSNFENGAEVGVNDFRASGRLCGAGRDLASPTSRALCPGTGTGGRGRSR